MLALRDQHQEPGDCVPNILPCRLHYSGPARVTKRFWSPTRENDNTKTSYFRGRRLRGKTLKLPPGYTGVAAQATERLLPQQLQQWRNEAGVDESAAGAEDEDLDDKPEPVKILQSTSTFNEVTIWGHDMLPAADDPFVKGIEEWIAFAEAIHVQPTDPEPRTAVTASVEADS